MATDILNHVYTTKMILSYSFLAWLNIAEKAVAEFLFFSFLFFFFSFGCLTKLSWPWGWMGVGDGVVQFKSQGNKRVLLVSQRPFMKRMRFTDC